MKRFVICFCTLLFISLPGTLFSQSEISRARQKLIEGQQYLDERNYDEAKKSFKSVLKSDKNNLVAYAFLGKIAIEEEEWNEASDQFDKILDRDPENIEAHYYRGIAYREIGKFRPKFANSIPLMNKLLEYQKSEKNFESVLAKDSLFNDVLFQYGLLQRYRDKYHEAICLGQRQIALKPDMVDSQIGLFRLYKYFIKSTGQDDAISWLQQQPWQYARFFIGEKLRREKKYEQADTVYHELLQEQPEMPIQAIYLAMAKSAFAQDKIQKAENYYWKAVDEIENHVGADLVFEDLKYILNNSELAAYQASETVAEKQDFFRAFWASRDPLPASASNVRLAEHYRRLLHAEDNYEYSGFRTWVKSADKLGYLDFPKTYKLNKEFNDKGLVYLRQGPPDDKVVTVHPSVPSNESWKYWESGRNPEMTFHFLYDENATGNLWTLTPSISYPEMLADRATWDIAYQKLLSISNPTEQYQYEDQIIYDSKKSVESGFSTDRHTWEKKVEPLDIAVSMATFRDPSGKTMLEVYYGVPILDVAKQFPDGNESFVIEKGLAIHDLNWQLLGKVTQDVTVPYQRKQLQPGKLYIDIFSTTLDPKEYKLGFHVRPQTTDFLGGFSNVQIKIPDYSFSSLAMSDIELAARIEPSQGKGMFVKNGLLILPNPSKSFSRDNFVHIYFEIYNLIRDSQGKTAFTIEYIVSKLDKKSSNPFDRRKRDRSSVSFSANRQGDDEFSAEFLAIDVKKLKKGDVVLSIRITDKNSKQSVIKESQFVLF